MSKLKNTSYIAGGTGLGYLSLKGLGNAGVGWAEKTTDIIDSVAGEAINILGNAGVEIGSLAPVTQKFIEELGGVMTNTSLFDLGIAGAGGLAAGWVGRKITEKTGKVIGVESESDNKIARVGIGTATGLGLLGATATSITIGAGTTGYVLGRKLGEKVLGEKYANISGAVGGLAATGLAWGASSSLILGSAGLIAAGGLIWKAGEGSRAKNSARRASRKAKKSA